MDEQKSLFTHLGEALDQYRAERRAMVRASAPVEHRGWLRWLGRHLVPNFGTLLMIVILLFTIPSLASPLHAPFAASTSLIPYQGRLADTDGTPTDRQI